ncbi:putative bifunctional diguanylate cyclase/phosphodiesterase [Spongisporangium articulatum]|uniref:Bifunctional diguanylate cyclase/phosphodiesterase n=1 Tax=Spongisporangium articulatum TaxID=3362603 RepID=A0ABW8APQ0_9ACTN
MKRLRMHLPRTELGKIRAVALAFSLFQVLAALVQVVQAQNTGLEALAVAAGCALSGLMITTAVIGRVISPWEAPTVALLVFLVGIGLQDPLSVLGLCIAVVLTQSLYGRPAVTFLRALALVAAAPLVLIISPAADEDDVHRHLMSLVSLALLVMLFVPLMWTLRRGLEQAARQTAREHFLATLGRRLLGASRMDEVGALIRASADDMVKLTPGLVMVAAHVTRPTEADPVGDVRIFAVHSDQGLTVDDVELPWHVVFDLDGYEGLEEGVVVPLPAATTKVMMAAGLPRRDWYVVKPGVGSRDGEGIGVNWVVGGLPQTWATRWLRHKAVPPADFVENNRLLTAQKRLAEARTDLLADLQYQASHDEITELPNRSKFFHDLRLAAEHAQSSGTTTAVLVVDIDDFSAVNATHGHVTGDTLLVEMAERILEVLDGRGTAARIAGDEFAVVVHGLSNDLEAHRLAERLRDKLLAPLRLPDGELLATASIGLAVLVDGMTGTDVVQAAGMAAHAAKSRGRGRIEVYSDGRHGGIVQSKQLEEALPYALAQRQIVVHYQPIVDLGTSRPVGLEALARWAHPELGLLEASAFIGLAERTGWAGALGAHVLRSACAQWQELTSEGLAPQDLWVSVNVSACQVVDPTFAETLADVLTETGLPGHRLVLEVAESAMLERDDLRPGLAAVAALGVRVSLDDFTAAHASPGQLQTIPVHQVKIDGALTAARGEVQVEQLTDVITVLCDALGIETVIKAVEDPEQIAWARHHGVTLGQGFHYAPALSGDQLATWLVEQEPARAAG